MIAHGRPHVSSERRRRSLGAAKAPEAQAHARFRTCLGHSVRPPCHYAGVLTRALRRPYGADKFAHFDTKNSVLMTWPPGLLGPKVLLAAATSMMPSEREDFAAEQAADRARRVLPPIILP